MNKIIIVAGPVIVENEKVLLNKHGDTTFWKFCGGKVEDFSTDLITNAKREAKEEMGIDLEILNKKPFVLHIYKKLEFGNVDVLLVHYLANRIGDINVASEIRQWEWIDIKNLPNDIGPNILPTLKYFNFID